MPKFHISKSGKTEPCKATKRACPLGEANHFDSVADAATYAASPAYQRKVTAARVQSQARKIANADAGRNVPADRVWVEDYHTGLLGEHQVRYTLPKTSGFFIANLPIYLDREDFDAYEAERES